MAKRKLIILGIGLGLSACGSESGNQAPITTTVTITAVPTTISTTTAPITQVPEVAVAPQPQMAPQQNSTYQEYSYPDLGYDPRSSGEIQFEWSCSEGLIDPDTCAASGYGHVVP